MAPIKLASKGPLGGINSIFSNGVSTRSRNGSNIKVPKEGMKVVGKRKAGSPLKETTAKRAAFGDITNAIAKAALHEKTKNIIVKKVTVEAKTLPSLKVLKQKCDNIPPLVPKPIKKHSGSKAVVPKENNIHKNVLLPPTKEIAKILHPIVSKADLAKTHKSDKSHFDFVKSGYSYKAPVSTRLSDEFSEVSLYVSAVEDISSANTTTSSNEKTIRLIEEKVEEVSKVPAGVTDFDKANWNDPFQVSHYAMDIFNYLKSREVSFPIEDYMSRQKSLTGGMRALLVDWMVEVQESFELNHETLYLAVKLVDLFLCKETTGKEELQLLGAASLFIASKFDERIPPLVDDFLYICDGAYNLRQLLTMEINVLKTIGFDLGIPLSYRFLRRYARCACVSMPTLTLARFVLELCLMEYAVVSMSDSKMAAAALYLAIRMKHLGTWTPTHVYYTGYSLEEILPVARVQNMCLHKKPKDALSTVRNKYSHTIFFEVAKVPLINNESLHSS